MYGAASDVRMTCGAFAPGPSFIPARICSANTSSGQVDARTCRCPGAARAIITSNIALVASPSASALDGLGAVAVARAVLGALAQVPALVLQGVHELVRERRLGLLVAEVARHVHRPVGGLVVAGELLLQQLVLRRLVVELRGDEAEQRELEPLVADGLRRAARASTCSFTRAMSAGRSSRTPGTALLRCEPARDLDSAEHARDEARSRVGWPVAGPRRRRAAAGAARTAEDAPAWRARRSRGGAPVGAASRDGERRRSATQATRSHRAPSSLARPRARMAAMASRVVRLA